MYIIEGEKGVEGEEDYDVTDFPSLSRRELTYVAGDQVKVDGEGFSWVLCSYIIKSHGEVTGDSPALLKVIKKLKEKKEYLPTSL